MFVNVSVSYLHISYTFLIFFPLDQYLFEYVSRKMERRNISKTRTSRVKWHARLRVLSRYLEALIVCEVSCLDRSTEFLLRIYMSHCDSPSSEARKWFSHLVKNNSTVRRILD